MEESKPSLPRKKVLKRAHEAKKHYRHGKTAEEIGKIMGLSTVTVWRYFQRTGGISKEDLAYHYKNRYLKKEPTSQS